MLKFIGGEGNERFLMKYINFLFREKDNDTLLSNLFEIKASMFIHLYSTHKKD